MHRFIKILTIFFFLSLEIHASESKNSCQWIPTGKFELSKGVIDENLGLKLEFDFFLYTALQKFSLTLIDLRSEKKIKVLEKLNSYPVARNLHFTKVLLKVTEGATEYLYLSDDQGQKIQTIEYPKELLEPFDPNSLSFNMDEKGKHIYIISTRQILDFDINNQNWKTVYSIEDKTSEFTDIQTNSSEIYTIYFKEKIFFGVNKLNQESKAGPTQYFVINSENHKEIFKFQGTESPTLLGDHLIVFSESKRVRTLNLETNKELLIPIPKGEELTLENRDFFLTVDGNLGIAYKSSGHIYLYSYDGKMIKFYSLEKMDEIFRLDQGRLFYKESQSKRIKLFDSWSGSTALFPDLIIGGLNPYSYYYNKNKLYFSVSSTVIEGQFQFQVFNLNLEIQCLKNSEIESVTVQSFDKIPDEFSILSYLAFEGKLSKELQSLVAREFQKLHFNQVTAMTYVNLVIDMIELNKNNSPLWNSYFNLLSNFFRNLSNVKQEITLDGIGIKTASKLKELSGLNEVPLSKIVNTIIESIKPFFGLDTRGRTDFVFVQNLKEAEPIILSTHVIDQNPKSEFFPGFFIKRLPKINLSDEKSPFTYQWTTQGIPWTSRGFIQSMNLSPLINPSDSINYNSLWKNHRLTGAIILSSNLKEGFEKLTMKMIDYYQSEGFDFGWSTVTSLEKNSGILNTLRHLKIVPANSIIISDPKKWLQSRVESGELDYWVKEAHSGGSDYLMELASENKLIQGTRKLSDGRIEEINILLPLITENNNDNHLTSIFVTPQELRDWVQLREFNQGGDLLYLNTSCWSRFNARSELIAVRNPLFHEIATAEPALTFENKIDNHERVLIDGIRKGKSYTEIKIELLKIKSSLNPYIFPNDEIYNTTIWDNLNLALDYSVEIKPTH